MGRQQAVPGERFDVWQFYRLRPPRFQDEHVERKRTLSNAREPPASTFVSRKGDAAECASSRGVFCSGSPPGRATSRFLSLLRHFSS